MLRGRAEILADGPEHGRAQALLQARYRQLAAMQLAGLPVIAIRIERVASWGDLGATDPATPGRFARLRPGSISPAIQPTFQRPCLIRGRLGGTDRIQCMSACPARLSRTPSSFSAGACSVDFRSRAVTFAGPLAPSDQGR